ncbi:MAG: glycosyltransferase [Proteobacteria bacterium]|nr:glycosyltransferase [Pseudomonadota bacterium]
MTNQIPASDTAETHFEHALAHYGAGRLRDAWTECGRVIALAPAHARAIHLGGAILLDSGHLDAAITELTRALSLDATAAGAWLDLARALDQAARPADAIEARREAVRQAPRDAEVLSSTAAGFLHTGHIPEAIETATAATQLRPDFPGAWFNLALALQAGHRIREARTAIGRALLLVPEDARVVGVAAQLDGQLGDLEGARDRLRAAFQRNPRDVTLATELGYVASRLGDLTLATEAFEAVLVVDRDNGPALSQLIFADKELARWDRLPQLQQRFAAGVAAGRTWLSPFCYLSDPSTRAEQRRCAATWGAGFLPQYPVTAPPVAPHNSIRLRIGYLSADFHDHPTSVLIAGVLEHHDRARFEVYAYSTGQDDGSALRKRIVAAVDHFVDARELDPDQLAARIRADAIDVLVDLKGYTEGAPLAALARRPAPVQAHWVGYPGTLAAPYVDYLIADRVVVPAAHVADYAEAIAWLPNSYQPNDRSREVGSVPTRAALGLPEEGVVLCAFNAAWKINPDVFAAWLTVLERAPGSVLWMLQRGDDDPVPGRLRRAASARGIDPARLVFSTRRPAPDYLALYEHADLFLDTWPYNAHTTASDALWMGVPVITWLGNTFAGRVAASLLTAMGLTDLVAPSVDGFVDLAARLANDEAARHALLRRIEAARYAAPLFDARATTRAVESAFRTMHEQSKLGRRASFAVDVTG